MKREAVLPAAVFALASTVVGLEPAHAQFGALGSAVKRAQQFQDVQMTDAEEQRIGAAVSERIRLRFGVVQDPAIHRYVTLVGAVLTPASTRPTLSYQFIVLDTDGVNAFAAPGGYVHITRGALALLKSESELAGVLAHEVVHIAEKHTTRAIQKGKLVQMGANETLSGNKALFDSLVDKATDVVMAGFGRAEELESDDKGLVIVDKVGYAPQGLSNFLTTLAERNTNASGKQGLFASHPEMKERQQRITKQISSQRLMASITLNERYVKFVTYTPTAQSAIAQVEAGAAGLTGDQPSTQKKPEEQPKGGGFGLSKLVKPGGGEQKSAEVTGSGASRGVDTERNAKGGAVSKPVPVTVTPPEIAAFRREGSLS